MGKVLFLAAAAAAALPCWLDLVGGWVRAD